MAQPNETREPTICPSLQHEVLAANARGISVLLCNHSNSERGYLHDVLQRLLGMFMDDDYSFRSAPKTVTLWSWCNLELPEISSFGHLLFTREIPPLCRFSTSRFFQCKAGRSETEESHCQDDGNQLDQEQVLRSRDLGKSAFSGLGQAAAG